MITSQVYQSISTSELARVVEACGFISEVDESGGKQRVWITVAGRVTLASIIGPDRSPASLILLMGTMDQQTNAEHANAYNLAIANWCTVYVDEGRPMIVMPIDVNGITRHNLATKMYHWEFGVTEFQRHFR
ncbi:MAG: hypothetical protein JNL06_03645 [Alphaproteobacteria bacterium]|nr:hypothetical protein [Alphaproteobacteria bacterium]